MKQKQNFVPFCFLLFPSPHCRLCRFVEPALVRLSRILSAQEHICGKDQAILLKQPLDISGSQLEFCSLMMSLLTGFFLIYFRALIPLFEFEFMILLFVFVVVFLLIILSFSCPPNNNPLLSFDFIIVTAFYFALYSLLILIRF